MACRLVNPERTKMLKLLTHVYQLSANSCCEKQAKKSLNLLGNFMRDFVGEARQGGCCSDERRGIERSGDDKPIRAIVDQRLSTNALGVTSVKDSHVVHKVSHTRRAALVVSSSKRASNIETLTG